MVRYIAGCTGIRKSIVQCILKSDLKRSFVNAQWVPRLHTEEEKRPRVAASRTFLREVERDLTFLSRIISTDETLVNHIESGNKLMFDVDKHDSLKRSVSEPLQRNVFSNVLHVT